MYKKVLAYFLSFAITLSLFTMTPIRVNADVPIAPIIEEKASGNNYHALYANGLPLLIEEGTTPGYSNVKYDSNGDGEYDTVFRENIDLSGYDVFGGSPDTDCYAADIKMTGGKVHYILGGGHKSGSIEGDIKIGVSGGYIAEISSGCYTNTGTSAHVAGDAEIIISGGEIGGIYGGGWAWGSSSYSVMKNSTINISGGTIDKVEGGWVGSSGSSNITDSFAINISGGTIKGNVSVSDYVSEDADKTINITGGTIRGTIGGATPTNGTDFVYKTALRFMDGEEAKKNTFVSTLATNPDCGYGMTDVLTDGNGKIFVYLPEGTLTTAGVIDGDNYINTEGITTLSNNMAGGDLVFAPDSPEDYIFDISHGNITITDGTGEGTYKVIYGPEVSQQQKDNIPQMQTITITGNGAGNIITVSATIGTVKIMLAEMTASRMTLTSSDTRDVEIVLKDGTSNVIDSSLRNESGAAGGGITIICEHYGEEGHICDDTCGLLKVTHPTSMNSAAISGHNITINGGNVIATGGNSSPGIGVYGTAENITINGGNVSAEGRGSYGTAGIGGGDMGNANNIHITGGITKSYGYGSGAGIGAGAYFNLNGRGGNAHNILINGGTVVAPSTGNIGIGGSQTCSNIQINGGSVNAKSISIPPINVDGINVYLTTITLSGAGAWTQVPDLEISGADYFNQKDIFTDEDEKIYLYLPEEASVTGATAGGSSYGGSITTTNDNLAAETFTLPVFPPVLQSAVTNIGGTAVVLAFDKDMATPAGNNMQFTVMVDDNLNVVTAVALGADDTKTIELELITAIEFGQEVKVSYSEGTVTSSDGGLLASFTDIQVENNVPEPTYTINVGSLSGGSIEPSAISATAGTTINLTITPDTGKRLKDGTLKYNDGTKDTSIDETTKSFEMPAADITITAEFENIPEPTYTITIGSLSGGSIVASEISATAGTTINLTIIPGPRKRLKAGTLKYNDGSDHAITGESFIMPATNVTVMAEFENIPSSGSGGRGSAGESTPLDTGTEITVITTDGKTSVVGALTETEGTVRVVIKNNDFNKIDTADKPAIVNAQLATVTFDKKAIDTIGAVAGSGDVILTVRQIPISELPAVQKEQVGTRPVYNFTVTGDNKTISDFNGGYAMISIPYVLAAGENPYAIVIWHLSDNGKLVEMRGHYDTGTKSVIFKTPHFSDFIIGYNFVGFKDVPGDAWYESAVTFLAARGITTGTGDGKFSPDIALTRGQFIVMLMRAYGIGPDASPADNFADTGNTHYTNYLAVAKRLGISAGIGNNLFAPDREITRQEMFTLLYNTLTVIGEISEGNSGKRLSDFSDAAGISPWAKEAMTLLVETGTVSGSDGKLFPTDSTTRAEMAQVLYNLLIK